MAHVVYRAMTGAAPSVAVSDNSDANNLFSRARRMLPPLNGKNELNSGQLPTREQCEYLSVRCVTCIIDESIRRNKPRKESRIGIARLLRAYVH